MKKVGVRDLKNQLSQYLLYVKEGETVYITEHKKIIAEISVPKERKELITIEEKLIQLSKEGEIILAKSNKSRLKLPKINEKLDWENILSEIRADRI